MLNDASEERRERANRLILQIIWGRQVLGCKHGRSPRFDHRASNACNCTSKRIVIFSVVHFLGDEFLAVELVAYTT
jgi:hypothetical protein